MVIYWPLFMKNSTESERSLLIEKTSVWYKETDKKLNILVQQMVSLISHDNWKVRLAMVAWGHSLLTHCQENLPECLPSLLEVLVTLSHDSYPQVAHSAGNTVVSVLAHAHTHTRTHARTHAHTHACMHTRTHARTHAHAHTHIHTLVYVCTNAHAPTYTLRMHPRMHAHTHARTHTHTRTNASSTHACMHACMHYICMHPHTHARTHAFIHERKHTCTLYTAVGIITSNLTKLPAGLVFLLIIGSGFSAVCQGR